MILCVFIPLSDLDPKHTLRKMTMCLSDCSWRQTGDEQKGKVMFLLRDDKKDQTQAFRENHPENHRQEYRGSGINPLELGGGGKRRDVSGTRARIAKRGRDELGLSAAIARHAGVSTPAITKAIERM